MQTERRGYLYAVEVLEFQKKLGISWLTERSVPSVQELFSVDFNRRLVSNFIVW